MWVNGDDGVVRGIDVSSGKVVASLKGHEAGSKVRSIWAGMAQVRGSSEDGDEMSEPKEQEWIVSGGFDKKVIIWKVAGQDRETDR